MIENEEKVYLNENNELKEECMRIYKRRIL